MMLIRTSNEGGVYLVDPNPQDLQEARFREWFLIRRSEIPALHRKTINQGSSNQELSGSTQSSTDPRSMFAMQLFVISLLSCLLRLTVRDKLSTVHLWRPSEKTKQT